MRKNPTRRGGAMEAGTAPVPGTASGWERWRASIVAVLVRSRRYAPAVAASSCFAASWASWATCCTGSRHSDRRWRRGIDVNTAPLQMRQGPGRSKRPSPVSSTSTTSPWSCTAQGIRRGFGRASVSPPCTTARPSGDLHAGGRARSLTASRPSWPTKVASRRRPRGTRCHTRLVHAGAARLRHANPARQLCTRCARGAGGGSARAYR